MQTAVEHFGDVRMVHDGQRLPFGVEAGQHAFGVHAGFDELDSDLALHRLGLVRDPDAAHAPFADEFGKPILAGQDRAGFRIGCRVIRTRLASAERRGHARVPGGFGRSGRFLRGVREGLVVGIGGIHASLRKQRF